MGDKMDKNLLKYQDFDKKIKSLKNGNVDTKLQTALQNAINETKKWQANILELEQMSKRLLEEYNKLVSVESKGIAFVDKFSKMDIEKMSSDELNDFALKTMISDDVWSEIINKVSEKNCLQISKKYKIPMSFIVGRLAKFKIIKYDSELYNKYKMD